MLGRNKFVDRYISMMYEHTERNARDVRFLDHPSSIVANDWTLYVYISEWGATT